MSDCIPTESPLPVPKPNPPFLLRLNCSRMSFSYILCVEDCTLPCTKWNLKSYFLRKSLPTWLKLTVVAVAKLLQSCPTLCDPIDGSPPGSRPWDSPGKNTGVGCHFLLQCMKMKSESEVTQLVPDKLESMGIPHTQEGQRQQSETRSICHPSRGMQWGPGFPWAAGPLMWW